MIPKKMTRKTIRLARPSSAWTSPTARPLRFTPYAWAKLLFLCDLGPTEVGGFGISAPDDLLLVEDIALVGQICSEVTVQFEDGAVADFFDWQVDLGQHPEQFGRIWIHSHPGNSPWPSQTDETTFARCFGAADWAVMFIVARGGRTYARIQFRAGPGGDLVLPTEVDFCRWFPSAAPQEWEDEYRRSVGIDVSQWLQPVAQTPPNSGAIAVGVADLGVFATEQELKTSLWPEEAAYERRF